MGKWFLSVMVVFLFTANAQAAVQVELRTDQPPGNPLVVNAGQVSGPMVVSVVDTSVPATLPAEFMAGWEIELVIEPLGGFGTVEFENAVEATNNYIFAGIPSLFGVLVTNPSPITMGLSAFDFNFPFNGGVEVPTDPGANLVDISFRALPGASGLFGVFAVAGENAFALGEPTLTEWTDATPLDQQTRAFANVPPNSRVLIGQVFVEAAVIPEPASLLVWCTLFSIVLMAQCRRKRFTAMS